MRTFAETLARPLSIVRELFHQQGTALTGRNLARDEHAEAAVYGPDLAGAMTQRTPIPATYAKTATHEDIFYCFRLLLGRNPNPEEWPGHSSRVGEDLENVVSSYVTSREFAERNLLNKTYRDQVELVRLSRFSLFASNDDLAVGRHVRAGSYEPGVAAVLMRYVKPGMSVVDIGANIGYFTMLLASLVEPIGLVVAVEPNPENIKLIEASRRVNGFDQVLIIQAAAGRHTGLLSLNVSHSNGMTAELSSNLDAVFASRPVPCFALDAILPKDRHFSLVKLDTEGAELNALIGLSEAIDRDRPVIVSEFSPGTLPDISRCSGPEYLRFLIGKGYWIGVIEQDGSEEPFGDDVDGVMGAYSRSGIDHIDILATPI
jgi:FkbM family methyltransferase